MSLLDKLDKHANLVSGMSERVGVDWDEAMARRPDLAQQYRNAVFKCTQCREVCACQSWLETHNHARVAPDYCENRDLFAELKDL